MRGWWGAVVLSLGSSLSVGAQEQSASLVGVVRDPQGATVGGAAVEVASAAGLRGSAAADEVGRYRFPALAPGTYSVTARASGFAAGRIEGVALRLGQTLVVDLFLTVAGTSETVDVVGSPPLLDVRQSASVSSWRGWALSGLPRGRDFTWVATLCGSVCSEVKAGGLSALGSSGAENRFVVDGVDTTDPLTGVSAKEVNAEVAEEVQVKLAGLAAEFGGSTGSVVSVLTHSGTDAWKGTVGTHYSSDELDGRTRPTLRPDGGQQIYPRDNRALWEPGFQFAGPLVRSRLWFFVGYQPVLAKTEREATRSDGSTTAVTQSHKGQAITASLSGQLSARTRVRLAANWASRSYQGILPGRTTVFTPEADLASPRMLLPAHSFSASVDHTAAVWAHLSLRAGYFISDYRTADVHEGPRFVFRTSNLGLAGVPLSLQCGVNCTSAGSNFRSEKDKLTRLGLKLDGTFFARFAGEHTAKVGIQFDRTGNDAYSYDAGNVVSLHWNARRSPSDGYGYYYVRSNGSEPRKGFRTWGDVRSDSLALFLQDSWSLTEHITINLGLRAEREAVPAFSGEDPIVEFGFADKLAPRLGVAWDPSGEGRWKLHGSWGLFYDSMKLNLARGSFGGEQWLDYQYTLETYDWPNLLSSPECPPACPGRLLDVTDHRVPSTYRVDPGLRPMRQREAVLGVEQAVGRQVRLFVRYVHRQLDRAVEDVGSLDAAGNEVYSIANPGFGVAASTGLGPEQPKAKREYDGVEVGIDGRSRRLLAGASYLWSRLHGNYTGLALGDEDGRLSPNTGRAFDHPMISFDGRGAPVDGPLPTDRPHQFKAYAALDLPWGFSWGLKAYWASGAPVTRYVALIGNHAFPVQYLGRGSDGRLPAFSQLDVLLAKEFRLGGARLQISGNVLNILDSSTAIDRYSRQPLSGRVLVVDERGFFSGIDVPALMTAQGAAQDPRFLQDSAYQAPRTIRLGAKLVF